MQLKVNTTAMQPNQDDIFIHKNNKINTNLIQMTKIM